MKRLLFGALFLSTALLLTACPQTPPPPVNPAECPVGPLRVQSLDAPSKLHGLGSFKGEFVPGELIVVPKPGLSLQSLRASGVEPQAQLALDVIKVKVPHGEEKVRAEALLRAGEFPDGGIWSVPTTSRAFIYKGDAKEEITGVPGNYGAFYLAVKAALTDGAAWPISQEEVLAVARIIDRAREINAR